eukprot:CAMPEP_0114235664 /NCGR_PEP_ID=MMETSP0058-20121206/6376_1 /TAXON_ID=36894 /ORGANISM="Pyramimonas parkeae, CCMP726" /LENGTH=288 /DNA_ID=CAMNT_0001347451 /DNA_START=269 /DNA_END=1135 /DNA_ORIENTATION=-
MGSAGLQPNLRNAGALNRTSRRGTPSLCRAQSSQEESGVQEGAPAVSVREEPGRWLGVGAVVCAAPLLMLLSWFGGVPPEASLQMLDFFGTVVFAASGCITAGQHRMDLLGCLLLGTCTGIGGGTLRDALIGRTPVFWMHQVEYLWLCVVTSGVVFLLRKPVTKLMGSNAFSSAMLWADAVGLAAFAVVGAQVGTQEGLSPLVSSICGMMTGTFGGLVRDVCCRRPPLILTREVYAAAAFAGGAAYCASRALLAHSRAAILVGFVAALVLRALAIAWKLNLPTWSDEA